MIETVAETGSTNSDLIDRLKSGQFVGEGDWLVADRQVAGRGRQGRVWSDGYGNFMGSTVVRPGPGDPPAASLSLLAGLALYEALAPICPATSQPMLKWPNDLLVDGAKLSGILLEGEGEVIVVGIGVNLAHAPHVPDRPTVALSAFGPAPDRDLFASNIARSLDIELERWRNFGLAPMLRRWMAAAHPLGTALSVHDGSGQRLSGTFAGLDEAGALRLTLANGERRTIHAGDVVLGDTI